MRMYNELKELFIKKFQSNNLVNVSFDEFKKEITSKIGVVDFISEGYLDAEKQRDLSVKFQWGHDHDFGNSFFVPGNMKDRHISIVSKFIEDYGLRRDLSGAKVLDIGAWTGGMSLLLTAMGAEVIALEEVKKYAQMTNYLGSAFGLIDKMHCYPESLYDILPMFADTFDIVIFSGVLYHVTDPILSLRLIFSALKDGGELYIETLGIQGEENVCEYWGPEMFGVGSKEKKNRTGWNYFVPTSKVVERWCNDVGFTKVQVGKIDSGRIMAKAQRDKFTDINRAGLSRKYTR